MSGGLDRDLRDSDEDTTFLIVAPGWRGVSGRGPGHHGAVHRQVESSLQDEEIC